MSTRVRQRKQVGMKEPVKSVADSLYCIVRMFYVFFPLFVVSSLLIRKKLRVTIKLDIFPSTATVSYTHLTLPTIYPV